MSVWGQYSAHLARSGDSGNTVTKTSNDGWDDSVYGAEWLASDTSFVHRWQMQWHRGPWCGFGVITTGHHEDVNQRCKANHSYVHDFNGWTCTNGWPISTSAPTYTVGDVLVYSLDLMSKQIRVRVNAGQEVVLFDGIRVGADVRYKLAMTLFGQNTSVMVTEIAVCFRAVPMQEAARALCLRVHHSETRCVAS